MREIKFRGKRVDNGEWIYGNLVYMQDLGTRWTTGIQMQSGDGFRPWGAVPVNSETIGQYTGLKDKNGVEIFEGDVLLFNNSINDMNRKWKCVVKYREGSFVCVYPNDNVYNHFDSWNVPKVTWEVIGNKFEDGGLIDSK